MIITKAKENLQPRLRIKGVIKPGETRRQAVCLDRMNSKYLPGYLYHQDWIYYVTADGKQTKIEKA